MLCANRERKAPWMTIAARLHGEMRRPLINFTYERKQHPWLIMKTGREHFTCFLHCGARVRGGSEFHSGRFTNSIADRRLGCALCQSPMSRPRAKCCSNVYCRHWVCCCARGLWASAVRMAASGENRIKNKTHMGSQRPQKPKRKEVLVGQWEPTKGAIPEGKGDMGCPRASLPPPL
jgi:hypothetical protein